jgi:hypothetical protein
MRRPYLPRLIKAVVLLLISLMPFLGTRQVVVTANLPAVQYAQSCSDSVANCKTPVKFLGDNKGCSCFACEYGKKTQRILCSNNIAEKNKFRALLPKTKTVK